MTATENERVQLRDFLDKVANTARHKNVARLTLTYGDFADGAQLREGTSIAAMLDYPSRILKDVGLGRDGGPVAVGPDCHWRDHWLKFTVVHRG